MDTKNLVEIFSAALTPMIAIATTCILYLQWHTNKNRLTHDLYDRRLTVFKAVKAHYGEIGIAGTAKYGMVSKFYASIGEAEFLFGHEITEHIDELYTKGIKLASLHERMYPGSEQPGLPVGPERTKVAEEHSDLVRWFLEDGALQTGKRFRKYLAISV